MSHNIKRAMPWLILIIMWIGLLDSQQSRAQITTIQGTKQLERQRDKRWETSVPQRKVMARLDSDKNIINVGERIRLTINITPSFEGLEYQFNFGDKTGTLWINEPSVEHVYKSEGAYKAVAVVRRKTENTVSILTMVPVTIESNTLLIQVQRPVSYRVSLEANKTSVYLGEVIQFSASVNPPL